MKLKLMGIALLFPLTALADNTVTFLGEVSDSTCNVTVNGTAGNVSVLLPTIPASVLSEAAETAGQTPFKFVVSGCTADTQKTVGMRLVPVSVTATGGNLTNLATVTPAQKVDIQIVDNYNNGNNVIDFTSGEYVSTTLATLPTAGQQLEFPFTAQYYATGQATVGKVESQLQYALTYK